METTNQSSAAVLIFTVRKPGTTFEQFKSYYEDNHIPLVKTLVMKDDLRPLSHTRNYIQRDKTGEGSAPSFPIGGEDGWEYDCISQVVFRDESHRDATFAEFRKRHEEIGEDEEKFLDRSKVKIVFVSHNPTSVRT